MKKNIYIPLLISLCCFCYAQGHAQQSTRPSAENEQRRIASVLSVSEAKASEIGKALSHGQQEIEGILKGKQFGRPEGKLRVEQLLAERRSKLSQLVSASQLAKLVPPVSVVFQNKLADAKARFKQMTVQNALPIKKNN